MFSSEDTSEVVEEVNHSGCLVREDGAGNRVKHLTGVYTTP